MGIMGIFIIIVAQLRELRLSRDVSKSEES